MPTAARVASLHRYPVKSMLGEQLGRLDLDARGCVGDRVWSVRTAADKIGSGKNTRRFAAVDGLLELRAAERDGRVQVTFPDGGRCAIDTAEAADRVSRHVGQPVTLARESGTSHFDDGPVSLIGHASILALAGHLGQPVDPGRFRANIVLATAEPFLEDSWVGQRIQLGTAVLQVSMTSPRCVMVNARTGELPAQPGNLAAIARINDSCLGVVASVVVAGSICDGDPVVTFR